MSAALEAGMLKAERALLSSGEDGGTQARRALEVLDRALLEALRRAETGPARSAAARRRRELAGYAFYRRGILRRLLARGFRPDAQALRALYAGSGSDRLILLVTHACQLRCAYCRVRKYGATMTPEVAEAGVRWLMGSMREDVELQFFGGEPLLALPIIKRAVSLARRLGARSGKRVRFLLTTNGLALDAEAAEFLRKEGFSVEISCDGTMSAQDSQRPRTTGEGSWKALSAGLERLRAAGVTYQVISVVLPEDAGRAHERVGALAALGHRRVQVNYALGRYWTPAQAEALRASLSRAAGLGVDLVNLTARRREPVVLNSELTVDCDGMVFRETGVCLEEDFQEMKRRFRVTDVRTAGLFESYGATPFDNLALLSSAYGSGGIRRTLLSNLEMGLALAEAR